MTDKEKIKELRDEVRQYESIVNEKRDELIAHRVAIMKIDAALQEYWEELAKIRQNAQKGKY